MKESLKRLTAGAALAAGSILAPHMDNPAGAQEVPPAEATADAPAESPVNAKNTNQEVALPAEEPNIGEAMGPAERQDYTEIGEPLGPNTREGDSTTSTTDTTLPPTSTTETTAPPTTDTTVDIGEPLGPTERPEIGEPLGPTTRGEQPLDELPATGAGGLEDLKQVVGFAAAAGAGALGAKKGIEGRQRDKAAQNK